MTRELNQEAKDFIYECFAFKDTDKLIVVEGETFAQCRVLISKYNGTRRCWICLDKEEARFIISNSYWI